MEYGEAKPEPGSAFRDVVNKSTIEADISTLLGHAGAHPSVPLTQCTHTQPPDLCTLCYAPYVCVCVCVCLLTGECATFEYIFVENVQPSFYLTPRWLFGGFGPAFGHAAIAYTRPDGSRRLVNIVGGLEAAGGREMVEFWEKPCASSGVELASLAVPCVTQEGVKRALRTQARG